MSNAENALEAFIAAILDTDKYKTYAEELAKVKANPQLKAQLDDFRKRNYELQNSPTLDFYKLDCFEKEYQTIRENPLAADFLAAEVDFCRMMQAMNLRIAEALHFE